MLFKKTKLVDFILMKHEGTTNNIAYQAIRTNGKRGQYTLYNVDESNDFIKLKNVVEVGVSTIVIH